MNTFIPFLFLISFSTFANPPTFNREVVRIFQEKCQSCHRPGGLAPFSLTEYAMAKRLAARIDDAVASRRMPPWPPAADCDEYRADRSLSQQQIDTIHNWVVAGAPEGDAKDLPATLPFNNDWILGDPELSLASEKPFQVPPRGHDIYRCFVLPYVADKDGFIVGMELKPENVSVVHHGIIYLDPAGESPALIDPKDPQPGYTCFGGPGFQNGRIIGGWAPGSVPEFLPAQVGIKVPKGARIVLQIHYHPDGTARADQTKLGLHFNKQPITKPLHIGGIMDAKNLLIPAGEPNYKISTELTLPRDIEVLNVFPHMHLLGKSIGLEAILPDNSRQCLIQINKWDFHWQGFYSFKNFISLPRGTRLRMTGVYDNSENNPHQFYHPPRDIRWGEQTVDEMFLSFFGFILK